MATDLYGLVLHSFSEPDRLPKGQGHRDKTRSVRPVLSCDFQHLLLTSTISDTSESDAPNMIEN